MLTNKTRKGLSWAASIALATASFVGISAPANAAIGVVEPQAGTSTTFVGGENFTLRLNGSYASGTALRWEVTVPSGGFADYTVLTSTASGAVAAPVATSTTSTTIVATPLLQTGPGENKIVIKQNATTSATSVVVRAYIETNGVAGYQAADESATPVTVNFIKLDAATPVITATQPIQGDSGFDGKVEFSNINNEQLNHLSLSATVGYADVATNYSSVQIATWSSTAKFAISASGGIATIAKDKAIKVRVSFNNVALGSDATTFVVQNQTVGSYTTSGVVSANLATSASGQVKTRLNSAFSVKITAKDLANYASATASGVANAAVTVAVDSSATMSPTATTLQTLTINGTAYTDKAKLPGKTGIDKLALKTDSKGEIVLSISTANFIAGNTVTLTVQAENLTSQTFVIYQESAAFSAFLAEHIDGATTVAKGATSVGVLVRDQFGGVPADGKYQVKALYVSSANRTTAATSASGSVTNVVGGAATAVITDDGAGAGTSTYNIKLVELKPLESDVVTAVKDGYVVAYTATALSAGTITVTGSGVAQNATTKVYTKTVAQALTGEDLFAHDSRTAIVGAPDVTGGAEFNGTVSSAVSALAAATNLGGVKVTVTGPADTMIGFTGYTGETVFGMGSVSGYTNKDGGYSFIVYSNISGKKTLTITAGSATATLVVDKFALAAAGTGDKLTLDVPAFVLPGSTFTAKIKLVDEYGNGVNTTNESTAGVTNSIKVTYVGPGLLVGSNPSNTDDDGAASLGYFLGANDSGDIKVTVQYDQNGDGDYTDTDDLTVTKTTTIGKAPASTTGVTATVGTFTGYVAVFVKGAAGKKLSVKVAGKWSVVPSVVDGAKGYYLFKRNTGAGYTAKVEVYVDGSLVQSKTITTK